MRRDTKKGKVVALLAGIGAAESVDVAGTIGTVFFIFDAFVTENY
jgi:hypothetical protein